MVCQMYMYVKTYQIAYFKHGWLVVSHLHLSKAVQSKNRNKRPKD